MWRNISAIVFGFAIIGFLVAVTNLLFALGIDGFDTLTRRPAFYYAISVATAVVYSVFGGWTCAFLARRRRTAIFAMVILGELLCIAASAYLWKTVPRRYTFAFAVLYPFAVLFGEKNFEWTRPVKKRLRRAMPHLET
jgi:hypothetical protein